jgi:hypothetical protein
MKVSLMQYLCDGRQLVIPLIPSLLMYTRRLRACDWLCVQIKGVLAGLLSSLHDFNLPPSPAGSTPISIAGGQGPVIGQAGTREQLAEVLTALGPALQG